MQFYMLTIFHYLAILHYQNSELTNHLFPLVGQHVIFTSSHNWIGFCHGQMLIETATLYH